VTKLSFVVQHYYSQHISFTNMNWRKISIHCGLSVESETQQRHYYYRGCDM